MLKVSRQATLTACALFFALGLLPLALSAQIPNIGLLANLNPGSASSSPSNLAKLGSIVIFSANDGTNGTELWKSDGTVAGTVLIKDIRSGSSSSSPSNFVVMGGFVYFTANDGVVGGALWRTDGTTAPSSPQKCTFRHFSATASGKATRSNENFSEIKYLGHVLKVITGRKRAQK